MDDVNHTHDFNDNNHLFHAIIMAFEFEENTTITEETRGLFRTSSNWIKAFSIISLILLTLYTFFLLVGFSSAEAQFLNALPKNVDAEIFEAFRTMFKVMMIFFIVFCVLMLFASFKLLLAGNSMNDISKSNNGASYTKAFKELKIFWMAVGIMIIIGVVTFVYLVVMMMNAAQNAAPL